MILTTRLPRSLSLLLLAAVLIAMSACRMGQEAPDFHAPTQKNLVTTYELGQMTKERFDQEWRVAAGAWTFDDGKLIGSLSQDEATAQGLELPQAMVWFKGALPHEFRLTYKAKTTKRAGDIITYICADGEQMSGYDVVLGGWNNERHRLSFYEKPGDINARTGLDRMRGANMKDNKTYEVIIERTVKGIEVRLDGDVILEHPELTKHIDDDHRSIALCTWDNEIEIWDLKIEGLKTPIEK